MNVRAVGLVVATVLCVYAPFSRAQTALPLEWTRSDGPFTGGVSDIAVAPSGVLLAATSHGVLRSEDDGRSWIHCDMPHSLSYQGAKLVRRAPDGQWFVAMSQQDMVRYSDDSCVTSSAVVLPRDFNSPRSVSALAVLPSGRFLASRWGFGLFWSDDEGATWQKSNIGPNDWINSIQFLESRVIASSAGGRVFESSDEGRTWTRVETAPPPETGRSPQSIAVGPNGALIGASGLGVLASTDGGRSWQPLGLNGRLVWRAMAAPPRAASRGGQTQLFAGVHVPDRPDNEVFRSDDSGKLWARLPAGVRGRVYALAYTRMGTFIVGTDRGFYRSADDGLTWTFAGVAPEQLRSIAVLPNSVIVAEGDGLWRSDDGARTWHRLEQPAAGRVRFLNDGRLLASGQISSDQGATWQRTGLAWGIDALLELEDGTLLAGTYRGLFRSTDGAASWVEHSTGLTRFDIVALVTRRNNAILAATGDGVFQSTDAGRSWRPHRITGRSPRITHFTNGPDARVLAGTAQGVLEYIPDTREWRTVAETASHVTALVTDATGRIWVGTQADGVRMLHLTGGTWTHASAGLPGQTITALAVDRTGRLVASTENGTFWAAVSP